MACRLGGLAVGVGTLLRLAVEYLLENGGRLVAVALGQLVEGGGDGRGTGRGGLLRQGVDGLVLRSDDLVLEGGLRLRPLDFGARLLLGGGDGGLELLLLLCGRSGDFGLSLVLSVMVVDAEADETDQEEGDSETGAADHDVAAASDEGATRIATDNVARRRRAGSGLSGSVDRRGSRRR